MASAQVLPNPRKLGHLEAGKKKLEEYRKKKAVGRAKKAASTGQLMPAEVEYEKDLRKDEHVRDVDKSATDTNSYRLRIPGEHTAVNSSHINEIHSSNMTHGSSSVLVDSSISSYRQYAEKEIPKLYEKSGMPVLVNDHYNQSKGSSELSYTKGFQIKPSNDTTKDQFDTLNPAKANLNIATDVNNSSSHSVFNVPSGEDSNSSSVHMSHPETSFTHFLRTPEMPERVSGQSRLGHPSTSADTSEADKGLSSWVDLSHSGGFGRNNSSDFSNGGRRMADTVDHNPNAGGTSWHAGKPSYEGFSMAYKGIQNEYPSVSTGSGTSFARSRPSFLDSLGVSRGSPMLEKANFPASDISMVQNSEASISPSPAQLYTENNAGYSLWPTTPNFENDKVSASTVVHSINGGLSKSAGDRHVQRDYELFTSKKDENFTALEQHIEDLTQEKFSLQRALETSRSLAESLAAENSSLAESYNQQGKLVSQLKSDMERLQEEIKAQLLAIESVRAEYMNAQLECNAADERASILTSEVIGLEEKALRLRSNELKLEKQLENLNSEITLYKRKVSILEKERQDFQSTVDALQEEKKLLQSKVRKASTNEKIDAKKTFTRRDMSTSTEDLGFEPSNLAGETSITNRMLNNTISTVQGSATMVPSTEASTSSLAPEDGMFALPDASSDIPYDQLRMIENINSLISELALEKEELVGALKIEASNCAKLKDLNKDLSQKLEAQTQRLELLTAQRMADGNVLQRPVDTHIMQDTTEYADEGDEVVERVLGWIIKLFPGGPSKRRTSKLL